MHFVDLSQRQQIAQQTGPTFHQDSSETPFAQRIQQLFESLQMIVAGTGQQLTASLLQMTTVTRIGARSYGNQYRRLVSGPDQLAVQ